MLTAILHQKHTLSSGMEFTHKELHIWLVKSLKLTVMMMIILFYTTPAAEFNFGEKQKGIDIFVVYKMPLF